jgi:hypothetical protein
MSRRSVETLIKRLDFAHKLVPINTHYRHYKGEIYKVNDFVINETTQTAMVVYERRPRLSIHHPHNVQFVRPFDEWFALGASFVRPRFITYNEHINNLSLRYQSLSRDLELAKRSVPINTDYWHYKGGLYRTKDLVINEETQSVMVMYSLVVLPLTDRLQNIKFVRPIEEWYELCEEKDSHDGWVHTPNRQVPRFERKD